MTKLKFICTGGLTGLLTYMYGTEYLNLINILVYFVIIDLTIGIVNALLTKSFTKQDLYKEIFKKAGELILISVMYKADCTGMFKSIIILQPVFITAFLGYEFYSIYTNLKAWGVPTSQATDDAVDKIKDSFTGGGKSG